MNRRFPVCGRGVGQAIGACGQVNRAFPENLENPPGAAPPRRTEFRHGPIALCERSCSARPATSVPGVYAIGDVIGPPWLAHLASEEAVTCVERMKGHHTLGIDYGSIPGCTYCNPQVGSVGMTERDAKAKGLKLRIGKYGLKAHGKAIAVGAAEGFVKIIASEPYGEILGAHIFGEDASELIHEICLARRLEATAEDIISTLHAHPTMAEAIHEAALGTENRMIHA